MTKQYFSITGPRDSEGRAPFTMFWLDVHGPWRPESSNTDGKPVGYRRTQCFRAVPEAYVARGATLADTVADAERFGHRHPDLDKPVRTLRCCCCDERIRGRQWHNRDTGYGVCGSCVKLTLSKRGESEDSVRRLFGLEGIHWNVEEEP